ncbi:hypothetical protein DFH29DRAFT_813490, partial [Suillus ampliporus]
EISYMVLILSASKMKKPKSKREPVNASIDLRTDKPWDTLKAQILVKISAVINPRMLCFDNYLLTYHISQVLPKPGLSFSTQADYDGMMKCVNGMAAKAPNVNINIIQQVVDENEKQGEDDPSRKNEQVIDCFGYLFSPTSSPQKESAAILPGNERKVRNIQLLRDHWVCKKTDSACPLTHCYLIPGMDEHFPLGHQQFDCWAAAMCKDTSEAMLEKPPNHRLFDAKATAISPVLQRRADAQSKTASTSFSTLVINFSFGNEFASFLKMNHAALNVPATNIGPAPDSTSSLLPPSSKPGNDMSIMSFCGLYKLDDTIAEKFASNSFKEARLLRYVTFADLKEMEFKIGKIAALRDAVERWSIPSDA